MSDKTTKKNAVHPKGGPQQSLLGVHLDMLYNWPEEKPLPDSSDQQGICDLVSELRLNGLIKNSGSLSIGALMTWLDDHREDDCVDIWVWGPMLGTGHVDKEGNYFWCCKRCLALYDERKRPEIVEHLLDVHRRGPDGYVENDNDQWSKRMTQDEIDQYLLFKECNCPNPIKGGRKDLNLSCTCRKDPIYDAKRLKSSMNEHVRSLMRQTGVHGTNSKGYDDLYEEIILHDSFLSPHFRQFWGLFQQRETGQYAKLWFTAFKSWQTDCNNKGCNDMTFSRGADSWNKLPACRKPLGQVEVSRLEMDAPIHSFLFEENRLLRDKVETLEMEAPIRSILLEENALLRDMVAMSNTMASMRTKETKLITDEAERLLRDKVERLEMEAPIHSFLLEKNGLLEYMVEMLKTMASIRSEETKLLKNEVARLEMEASLHSNEMEELKRKLEIIRGVFSGGDSC